MFRIPKNKPNRSCTHAKAVFLLAMTAAVLCLLAALTVFLIDPMFHYHKPWFGLKAVLTEKEYQVVGTLRHFDYDSLIAGSSVTENNNNAWFSENFNCTAIKAARSYGGNGDLCYLLDVAFETRDLKYVFYNIDPSSLTFSPDLTFEETGCPTYLYDRNPFNDIRYLLNKDILFEKIPYMFACSFLTDYDENLSYNWEKGKTFSREAAISHYERPEEVSAEYPEDHYARELSENIRILTAEAAAHPQTQFYFFLPPYSVLFWDNTYRNGELSAYLYNEEKLMDALLSYDNVRVFYFQNAEEIITDLDLYMDTLHFNSGVNHYMCDAMAKGEYEVLPGETVAAVESMRALALSATEELDVFFSE